MATCLEMKVLKSQNCFPRGWREVRILVTFPSSTDEESEAKFPPSSQICTQRSGCVSSQREFNLLKGTKFCFLSPIYISLKNKRWRGKLPPRDKATSVRTVSTCKHTRIYLDVGWARSSHFLIKEGKREQTSLQVHTKRGTTWTERAT